MSKNNLETLRICFIVKAFLYIFGIMFGAFYMFMGGMFQHSFESVSHEEHLEPFGLFTNLFFFVGLAIVLVSITLMILNFITANRLKENRSRNFCIVIAGINCITGILGILLGVFTIVELTKPEVKELFEES